jgi:hypothetical protein
MLENSRWNTTRLIEIWRHRVNATRTPFSTFNTPISTSATTSSAFITIRKRNIDMRITSIITYQYYWFYGSVFYGFTHSLDIFEKRIGQQVLEIIMKEVTFTTISLNLITAKGINLSNAKSERKEIHFPPVSFHYVMKVGHIVASIIESINAT